MGLWMERVLKLFLITYIDIFLLKDIIILHIIKNIHKWSYNELEFDE